MKKIVSHLKHFIKTDFDILSYIYTAVFLLISLFINYYIDFEHSILNQYLGTNKGIFFLFLFYSFAYYGVAIPIFILRKEWKILQNPQFYIKTFIFIFALSFASGFFYYQNWTNKLTNIYENWYIVKIIKNSLNIFIYIPVFLIVKYFFDKKNKGLYGLTFKNFSIKPYIYLYLMVLPLVIAASFTDDFLETYPRIHSWLLPDIFGLNKIQLTAIFEFFYLTDFVSVEWLFRGALVIAMSGIMGKNVILPMVAMYCFLHFGKPVGEAISSIFGGYILGIIAFYTRNIIGGCAVHMGIAAIMEIAAFYQHIFVKGQG